MRVNGVPGGHLGAPVGDPACFDSDLGFNFAPTGAEAAHRDFL